jgi:uncharacterized protein
MQMLIRYSGTAASVAADMPCSLSQRLVKLTLQNPWLKTVLTTVWNDAHRYSLTEHISDIDLVYFDSELAEESESSHILNAQKLFSDIPLRIDLKNQARVHLWYEARFGYPIAPYTSVEQAIATWPTTATAVGMSLDNDILTICAPFGLDDLFNLVVRPNKVQITRGIYEAKVSRWQKHWPKLQIVGWEESQVNQ